MFLPPFRRDSSAIWPSSLNSSADVVSARSEKSHCEFSVSPTPLTEPSGTVAAAAEPDPVDFKAMATEQNHCTEMHCLLCSSSLKLAFRQAGVQCLVGDVSTEFFVSSSQQNYERTIFCICKAFPTLLGGWPLGALFLFGLSGEASPTTSLAGKNHACTASGARSTATPACCRSPSPSISGALLISTLTWWALYSTIVVATTFSRSLIVHPSGWKQFPFLKHPRRHVHML